MTTLAPLLAASFMACLVACAGPGRRESTLPLDSDVHAALPIGEVAAKTRAQAVKDEVARLGPAHPWAGHYGYGACGWASNLGVSMAPESGFVASWSGRDGIYGAGAVVRDGNVIHLRFDELSPFGSAKRIPAEFVLVQTPSGRVLREIGGTEELHQQVPLRFEVSPPSASSGAR